VWKALPARGFPNYHAGSWGPSDADELMARDGREWRNIEGEEAGTEAKCPAPATREHAKA
jgi:glucose-6-phosphate 1-dehydrogenase